MKLRVLAPEPQDLSTGTVARRANREHVTPIWYRSDVQQHKHVLFVGAGLSRAFGFALTREILPEIIRRAKRGELYERALENEASALRFEFEGLLRAFLPGVLAAATDDLPSITDLLSLLDQLILSSQSASPEMTAEDVARLRSLFALAICELLSLSLDPERERHSMPLLDRLADWIVRCGRAETPVTVVTTNYDFVLEDAICRRLRYMQIVPEEHVDYGFTWRSTASGGLCHRPGQPVVRFLRLHGAVNWLRCRMCGFIYINQRGPIFHQTDRASDDRGNTCHCSALRLQRVIVAPSIVRRLNDADLHTVWKAALEELRLSQQWTVLGYSLPNEDVAIRSIFIRALRGRRDSPRVAVFERNALLEPRFRLLFDRSEFSAGGVERFIAELPERDITAADGLTHIESALPPATLESRDTKRRKGAAAMKQQAIQYVALDVHQATLVVSVDRRGLGCDEAECASDIALGCGDDDE